MSGELIIGAPDMAARLRQIDDQAREALARRVRDTEPVAVPTATSSFLVPVPRKARIFVRRGEGHGVFSEVTLTRPVRTAPA